MCSYRILIVIEDIISVALFVLFIYFRLLGQKK